MWQRNGKNMNFQYCRPTETKLNNLYKCHKNAMELKKNHLNIRSINANQRGLIQLLSELELKFDLIVLSEVWSYNIEFYQNILKDIHCTLIYL